MNVQELQKQIHIIYEGDMDYPDDPTDEDWLIRLGLINLAITEWAAVPNVIWRELAVAHESSGEDILTCPDDFDKMYLGEIEINGETAGQIPIEKISSYSGGTTPYFYLTGNANSGYKINLVNRESSVNTFVKYVYIKKPTLMESPDDVPELTDPGYIIHRVVAGLCDMDSDPRANKELAMSQTLLSQMIVRNAAPAYGADCSYIVE